MIVIGSLIATTAFADEEGPAFSFEQSNAYDDIEKNVDMLTVWAKGEYIEHKAVFEKHPEDDSIINATIALVEELKQRSKQAKKAGEQNKAQAYMLSAEATARYAAKMPHMLEERIEHKKHKH